MNLLDAPVREVVWAAIDFEGTGADPGQSDEAVQVGIAILAPGCKEPHNFFRSFVRAESRVTRAASAVHRITNRDIENAPSLPLLWPEIKSRLSGAVVVAHGAGTEKRFLRAFPMHGFGPWIDTLALARSAMPDLRDHSLASVIDACGLGPAVRRLCPDHDWHDALFDAVASLVFLRHFLLHPGADESVVGQLGSVDAASYYRGRRLRRAARDVGLDALG
jgi:DNA polymerase-3 subunit epsilon